MTSLLAGLDAIRSANIDDNNRGKFYVGLFGLATGLERLMKIVFILDHKIKFDLSNPTDNQLRSFGHDLVSLYNKCSFLESSNELKNSFSLNDEQEKILNVLSVFAKGSRYYNLNELTNKNKNEDPIVQWISVIDDHIWQLKPHIREKLQAEALQNANPSEWVQNIDGEWVTMVDFYYLFKATEKASYHIIWSIIELLRPFHGLLVNQVKTLHQIESAQDKEVEIPYMYEFFPFFLTSKSRVLRKKRWQWGK